MEVISLLEEIKDTFAEENFTKEGLKDQSVSAKLVSGLERSFALDTAALLGGDEFLIEQLVEELQKLEYNDNEQKALNWALTELWGQPAARKVFTTDNKSTGNKENRTQTNPPHNQGCLNKYFTEYNQVRLPRTLSTCLLYCGRHSDTKIYANPEDPTQRFLLVNLTNFPYMSLPVGSIPTNVDGSLHSRFQQCEKIAVIYCKLTYEKKRRPSKNYGTAPIGFSSIGSNWFQPERLVNVTNDGLKEGHARGRTRTTSISQSLALEKGMLSRIHCVGVVPVP